MEQLLRETLPTINPRDFALLLIVMAQFLVVTLLEVFLTVKACFKKMGSFTMEIFKMVYVRGRASLLC